jgi:hypothetical protein
MMAGRDKLIIGVILANVALIWLVCWPFSFQFQHRGKWGFSLFKFVIVVCVVTFDLLIGYALGKRSNEIATCAATLVPKAPEGWRTPRRFAKFKDSGSGRQLLECGSLLPLFHPSLY